MVELDEFGPNLRRFLCLTSRTGPVSCVHCRGRGGATARVELRQNLEVATVSEDAAARSVRLDLSQKKWVFHQALMSEETAWLLGGRALLIVSRCAIVNIFRFQTKPCFIFHSRAVWPPTRSARSRRSVAWWWWGLKDGKKKKKFCSLPAGAGAAGPSAVCFVLSWRPELQPNPITAPAWGERNWPVFG